MSECLSKREMQRHKWFRRFTDKVRKKVRTVINIDKYQPRKIRDAAACICMRERRALLTHAC